MGKTFSDKFRRANNIRKFKALNKKDKINSLLNKRTNERFDGQSYDNQVD